MSISSFIKNIRTEVNVIRGKETKDKYFSSRRRYRDRQTAEWAYALSRDKLFAVNDWSKLPGVSSSFRVYDGQGNIKAKGMPELGDFIFINLPGPSPEAWVEVIDLVDEDYWAEFTVSPSHDPRERGEKEEEIEHFFADEATSTFRVALSGTTLTASETGQEEGVNNQGKEAGGKELVNTLVAVGGWIAFQEIQWRKLTDYLVHKIELEEEDRDRSPLIPDDVGLIQSRSALARLGISSLSSIAGTTAMTAFSYGLSRLMHEQFREPQLLSYLLYRNSVFKRLQERQQANPRGFLLHYLAGQGFGLVYEYLWKPAARERQLSDAGRPMSVLSSGAVFGLAAGLAGVAVWEGVIRLREKPPRLEKQKYYSHLVLAHVVFGATAALVSRALHR
ncbi:hypothetical protein [Cesiribacter andamanensis]|uniref:Uncharacterized protein n=1 Tax=Cesiribacter andamanensis AMV16 TaxID=1279009 RepID=M7NP80_9BACT|nr:hypothetical protein [Cesiribacter andamanensis]EMR03530.1 hypothetical protein ADICEAN_01297 [Cesiribacter andamanensis AMV16]